MFPQFDPSKMDPQVMMQLSQLIQSLPPDQLSKMQGLMHNAMAGFDVRTQMEEFERGLPPGFREKLMTLVAANPMAFAPNGMAPMGGPGFGGAPSSSPQVGNSMQPPSQPLRASEGAVTSSEAEIEMNMREARLTVLRGVASGQVTPEDAERLLFKHQN